MAVIEHGCRYRIVNAKSGTVVNLSPLNNTYVSGWDFHGGQNQIWEASQEGDFWRFKNVRSGKWLAPESSDRRNSVKIIGSNTRFNWQIKTDEKDAGILRIYAPGTNFIVDLGGGRADCGTHVQLWNRWEPGKNQCWTFDKGMSAL